MSAADVRRGPDHEARLSWEDGPRGPPAEQITQALAMTSSENSFIQSMNSSLRRGLRLGPHV